MNVQSRLQQPNSGNIALKPHSSDRLLSKTQFLKNYGWEKAEISFLAADASFRSYERLTYQGKTLILMDAPPPHENTSAFQNISTALIQCELSAPQVYAEDHINGFLLLEDFGNYSYTQALAAGENETALYKLTLDALGQLHTNFSRQNLPQLTDYNLDVFLREALVFFDWYLPYQNIVLPEQARLEFQDAWKQAFKAIPELPHSLVLRDVLVDNLMYLQDRPKTNACGFLDFQDAIWGPICYDIVSLLEDARRDIDPDFALEMVKYYVQNNNLNLKDFLHGYRVWGAQRSTKILGVFARLATRDGKLRYLAHLPRLHRIVERNLHYPELTFIKTWFDTYLPHRNWSL